LNTLAGEVRYERRVRRDIAVRRDCFRGRSVSPFGHQCIAVDHDPTDLLRLHVLQELREGNGRWLMSSAHVVSGQTRNGEKHDENARTNPEKAGAWQFASEQGGPLTQQKEPPAGTSRSDRKMRPEF